MTVACRLRARLAHLVQLLFEDVRAICENDPAARSPLEVLLVYPGLHALWLHRMAHTLWHANVKTGARLLAHVTRFLTGIEIHPGARIGRRVFIDHGMGVVIGETATVSDDCVLYKEVNLGGTRLSKSVRHPQIGNHVIIGANASLLGAIRVGDHARIGSGSVVVKDVPPGATVVGVPAWVIKRSRVDAAADPTRLPDPVVGMIRALVRQSEKLQERVAVLERRLAADHADRPFPLGDGEELALPRQCTKPGAKEEIWR
jgi:serine O-acetyltransferase